MRLFKLAARLLFWTPILLTPLLGVWLASSWAAWANGPRWVVVGAGALLFPILPALWELWAERRRRRRLAAAREGKGFLNRMRVRASNQRLTRLVDRLLLRTLFLNGAFLALLYLVFPTQTLTAVGARGDWMFDGVSGAVAARSRSLLRTVSDRMQRYNGDFTDNEYAAHADTRLPEPGEVGGTVAVKRHEAREAELTLVLPEGATGQLGPHVIEGTRTLVLPLQPTVLGVRFGDGQRLSCPVDPTAGSLSLQAGRLGAEACEVLVEPDPTWRPAIHHALLFEGGRIQVGELIVAPSQVAAVHRNDPWLRVELEPGAHQRLCEVTQDRGHLLAVVVDGDLRFVHWTHEPLCEGLLPLDTEHPMGHQEREVQAPDEGGGDAGWPFAHEPDARLQSIPSGADDSIALLGRWIARQTDDEAERARLVHDWVALQVSYDVASLEPGQRAPQDADTVFRRRTGVCAGYANLYRALGRAAGLDVVYLVGNVRDERGALAGSGHAWNAVKVDGRWLLVDATWDAGYLEDGRFVPRYRTSYLFAPPEAFRLDHLPREDSWQLHPEPLSRGDFLRQPQLRLEARALNLDLVQPTTPQITARDTVRVELSNPDRHALTARIDDERCTVTDARFIDCPVRPGGNHQLRLFAAPSPGATHYVHVGSVTVQGS